jgi:hypothetical protein
MINTDANDEAEGASDAAVDAILQTGSIGAIVVAGLATAAVIGMWFAFYFLVFLPRASAP